MQEAHLVWLQLTTTTTHSINLMSHWIWQGSLRRKGSSQPHYLARFPGIDRKFFTTGVIKRGGMTVIGLLTRVASWGGFGVAGHAVGTTRYRAGGRTPAATLANHCEMVRTDRVPILKEFSGGQRPARRHFPCPWSLDDQSRDGQGFTPRLSRADVAQLWEGNCHLTY